MKFKVGQKVRNISKENEVRANDTGVVTLINDETIGVWWRNFRGGHSCSKTCDCDSGWLMLQEELELI